MKKISPQQYRKFVKGLASFADFGYVLRELRAMAGCSLRELQKVSGVPNSAISAMETGHRSCGPTYAEKLAEALFEGGCAEAGDFLSRAAATLKRHCSVAGADKYSPAVLTGIAHALSQSGIKGEDIVSTALVQRPGRRGEFKVELSNGEEYWIGVTVEKV